MRRLIFIFILLISFSSMGDETTDHEQVKLKSLKDDEESMLFRENLKIMLKRIEKSVKIIRRQISESQSAPF